MHPLVTISIPLYKCEDFLEACLESVRVQTYPNIEVSLINDQTPDNSVEIAEDFIKNRDLKNWKIYHLEENSGLSIVRNKGIDTAEGKYLFFLDSDDQILPHTIEEMVVLCENEKLQMVVGDAETVNIETGRVSGAFCVNMSEAFIKGNMSVLRGFVGGGFPSTSWNKLIEIKFLKENKLYFTKGLYAQDELHSFMLFLKLESIGFLHKKTYRYFLHQKSVIHNRNKIHFDNWATIISYFDAALKSETEEEIKALIRTHIINYKTMTLIMNWKAKKEESDWIYSFKLYRKYPNLRFGDYFRSQYCFETKKKALKLELPTSIAIRLFKYMYYR